MYSVAASPFVGWFVGRAKGLPLAIHRRAWMVAASKCDVWVCRVEGVVVGVSGGRLTLRLRARTRARKMAAEGRCVGAIGRLRMEIRRRYYCTAFCIRNRGWFCL